MGDGTTWLYSPSPWRVGSATTTQLLADALGLFRQLGVRVPESGRHAAALKLLERIHSSAGGIAGLPPAERRALEHAQRTAFETALIAVASFRLRRRRRSPFELEKLQLMMGGAPEYGPGRSPARDCQFEMFVAAQLALGGLDVTGGEPDLRFAFGYETVGVAVKRLDSLAATQIRRNISSAAGQIERSGLRGFVALNLDTTFEGLALFANRPTLLSRFGKAFDTVTPVAARYASGPRILGVMAYAHMSGWRPPTRSRRLPQLMIRAPFRWVGWETDDAAAKLFLDDFARAWRERANDAVAAIMRGEIHLVA